MNDIAIIKLTGKRGGFAIVDADVFPRVNNRSWHMANTGYPTTGKGKLLHRMIQELSPETDHINGVRFDCTRRNLRPATRAQNAYNNRKLKPATSQYKGVHWAKLNKKWRAVINPDGKKVSLGLFDSEIEAARAYDAAAIKRYGHFARPNFPQH